MNTRVKFLLLLIFSFGASTAAILLFLATDYAKTERAYFTAYPYQEMAARKAGDHAVPVSMAAVSPPVNQPDQDILLASPPQPETGHVLQDNTGVLTGHYMPFIVPEKTIRIIPPPEEKEPEISLTSDPPPVVAAPENPPSNWRHAANLGYDAYAIGDFQTAITYFERALTIFPENHDIRLQLAYAYKISGQNLKAAENFKRVIDHYVHPALFELKREVEQLENRFNLSAYAIYRDESANRQRLAGPDLTQSQIGAEISYQPENIGFQNGRKFQIYGRLLSAMALGKIKPNPDSYQAGFGLRLKPFSAHNLILSGERLVKVGDFARSDWMIRAGYSLDHGTDYSQEKVHWWSYSLYLDAAIIDPSDPDIFLTSQATGGYNIAVGQAVVLQPRLTALINWQKDSFHQASLIETGPGLNLKLYFNDSKYEAYRSSLDLTVEYRIKISGNSIGHSGPIISLTAYF